MAHTSIFVARAFADAGAVDYRGTRQALAARVPASDAGSGSPSVRQAAAARAHTGGDRFRPHGRGGSLKRACKRGADFSAPSPPALAAGTAPQGRGGVRVRPGPSLKLGFWVKAARGVIFRPATRRPLGAWSVPGLRIRRAATGELASMRQAHAAALLSDPRYAGPCDDVGQADVRDRRSMAFRAHSGSRKGLDGPDSTGQERELPSPAAVHSQCWLCRVAGTASFPLSPEGSANTHSVDERALLRQGATVVIGSAKHW